MNEIERALFDRFRKISSDESFIKAVMLFAWSVDCFNVLIEGFDDESLRSENDFLELIYLAYETYGEK